MKISINNLPLILLSCLFVLGCKQTTHNISPISIRESGQGVIYFPFYVYSSANEDKPFGVVYFETNWIENPITEKYPNTTYAKFDYYNIFYESNLTGRENHILRKAVMNTVGRVSYDASKSKSIMNVFLKFNPEDKTKPYPGKTYYDYNATITSDSKPYSIKTDSLIQIVFKTHLIIPSRPSKIELTSPKRTIWIRPAKDTVYTFPRSTFFDTKRKMEGNKL